MKVTIKKWGGDDELSWAVVINGVSVPSLSGLNRSQARSFRQQILDNVAREERFTDWVPGETIKDLGPAE